MQDAEYESRPGATRTCIVGPEGGGRLDRALAQVFADLSRSRLQGLVREGHVRCNGQPVRDPSQKIAVGARLDVVLPEAVAPDPAPEPIPLTVIHEDADLVVIDKPAGLVVHPGAGQETGTLVNGLIAHCGSSLSGIGGVRRPGIVHRLDKDTSGLLVVAKNDHAHRGLSEQFADHGRTGNLERAYLALSWGVPEPRGGTIRTHLARSRRNREKITVVREGEGRHAVTHYRVEAVPDPEVALVRCVLETGRTHQIRVHLAHLGHPLLGDAVYGAAYRTKSTRLAEAARTALVALDRQALHATLLGFDHPRSGEHLRFESRLPDDMAQLFAALQEGGETPRPNP